MATIRGKVHHGDGGRGLVAVTGRQRIQIGELPWRHCPIHNKYYDRKTGEEVEVVTKSLACLLEQCKLPCCKGGPDGGRT